MINIEMLNAMISAGTSITVVILSQILIGYKEKHRVQESEMNRLLKEYLNPVRFILAENYFRINKIVNETKKDGNNYAILVVDDKVEHFNKTTEWFVGEGCYLMTSCYLLSCLFAYMEKIRNDIPFLKLTKHKDTELIRLINKLTAGFSKNLNIYYGIQMNIGKEFYIQEEQRILTYREFSELLKNEDNLIWYRPLINYFLRMAKGEYHETEYILMDIKELTKYIDDIVLGGDSIAQKIRAEEEVRRRE